MSDDVLDKEEMQEWEEWMPDLIEAIGLGMLDKHIKVIAKECYKRRDVLIEQRAAKRKPRPGGASAAPTGPENRYKDMALPALGYAHGGSVHYNGEDFSKWSIQSMYASEPHKFEFTGTKVDGATATLIKVNRTNAVLRIDDLGNSRLGYGRGRVEAGDKINMPMTLLVKEAQAQTRNFHLWNQQNGVGNA